MSLAESLVEQAPDAIIFADRDGVIRTWNRAAERLFGFAAAEVVGSSLDVMIPEWLRERHWQGFQAALDSGRARHAGRVMPTRSLHKDGLKLYVDFTFSMVSDDAGRVVGALAIARPRNTGTDPL